MDEPLSNLDAKLRVQTRTQIASLQRSLGVTTVYVTHDQTEALTMGDRIAVMKDGLLQQVGTPREMYDEPANRFVAGFIGSPAMNLGTFTIEGTHAKLAGAVVPLSAATLAAVTPEDDGKIVVGFRPEGLRPIDNNSTTGIPIVVDLVEELGSDAYVYAHLAGTGEGIVDVGAQQIVVRVAPNSAPVAGSNMRVEIIEGQQHCFSHATGVRLPA